MIIAIDFDGTIVTNRFPDIGECIDNAFEAMHSLQAAGHQLILWTCREDAADRKYLEEAINFCVQRGLFFDAINENLEGSPYMHLGNSRKIYADLYIDDRAQLPFWEVFSDGIGIEFLNYING